MCTSLSSVKDIVSIGSALGSLGATVYGLTQAKTTAPKVKDGDVGTVETVDKTAVAEEAAKERRRLLASRGKASTIKTLVNFGDQDSSLQRRSLVGGV